MLCKVVLLYPQNIPVSYVYIISREMPNRSKTCPVWYVNGVCVCSFFPSLRHSSVTPPNDAQQSTVLRVDDDVHGDVHYARMSEWLAAMTLAATAVRYRHGRKFIIHTFAADSSKEHCRVHLLENMNAPVTECDAYDVCIAVGIAGACNTTFACILKRTHKHKQQINKQYANKADASGVGECGCICDWMPFVWRTIRQRKWQLCEGTKLCFYTQRDGWRRDGRCHLIKQMRPQQQYHHQQQKQQQQSNVSIGLFNTSTI